VLHSELRWEEEASSVIAVLEGSHHRRLALEVNTIAFAAGLREDGSMQETKVSNGADQHLQVPCRERAPQAFEQVLAARLPVLHRQAYRLLGNWADAEDAVQEALLAAYTHLDQFKGHSQMSSWVTAIVINSARMRLRSRLRHIHVPLEEPAGEVEAISVSERLADRRPNPEDEYRNHELGTRLSHFRNRLSPTLRRTFQLRAIDGLSIHETAQILGVPRGTVKAQFARARKKLKELILRAAKRPSYGRSDRLAGFRVRQVPLPSQVEGPRSARTASLY
jgi:RNA polymerase sigma-70 factor, ECF subfamily